jgi:hypothetical protein
MEKAVVLVWRESSVYTLDYVCKMINTLRRNVEGVLHILVLTDRAGIYTISNCFLLLFDKGFFPHISLVETSCPEWPGWWAKMEIFSPCLFPKLFEQVVYMDLDTVITGPINDIFQIETDFMALEERPINSSIMIFKPEKVSFLYEDMLRYWGNKRNKRFRGDQDLIGDSLKKRRFPFELLHVPGIVSYKNSVRGNVFDPEKHRIILFHGVPKPHELANNDPIKEYWK